MGFPSLSREASRQSPFGSLSFLKFTTILTLFGDFNVTFKLISAVLLNTNEYNIT